MVFAKNGFDRFLLTTRNIGNNQVLISGEAKIALVDFCNPAKSRFKLKSLGILNPAAFNEKCKMPFSIGSLCPAVCITIRFKGVRLCIFELIAQSLMQLFFKFFNANAVDGV